MWSTTVLSASSSTPTGVYRLGDKQEAASVDSWMPLQTNLAFMEIPVWSLQERMCQMKLGILAILEAQRRVWILAPQTAG
mgnify:CR=1 FL=1